MDAAAEWHALLDPNPSFGCGQRYVLPIADVSLAQPYSARRFYEEAFGWKFRDSTTTMDGREEDPSQIVHFSLGSTCPGGGITRVDPQEFIRTKGKGGPILYLIVDDLEESMKVSIVSPVTLR